MNYLDPVFEDRAAGSIPGSGTPWKVIGVLAVVQFLISVTFNAAGNFGFLLHMAYKHDNGSDAPAESVEDSSLYDVQSQGGHEHPHHGAMIREVYIFYLACTVLAMFTMGMLSDRYGRRKVLISSLFFAVIAVFIYTILLWPALAILEANGTWGIIVMCCMASFLGLFNGMPAIILAAGLDVSNVFCQGITVLIIVAFGQGPLSNFAAGFIDGIIAAFVKADLLFLIILVAFIFVVILGAALLIVWRFMPETLNAPVPDATVESGMSPALQDDAAQLMHTQDGSGPTALLATPVRLLSETQTWICFWTMSTFMALMMVGNAVTGVFFSVYGELDGVEQEHSFLPVIFISYGILALILSVIILVALIKVPAVIVEIGYTRIFLVCVCTMFGVQVCQLVLTAIMGILPAEYWIYWVGGFFFFGIIMASIASLFVGWLTLVLMTVNNGFRNEGGFLVALVYTAATVGFIPIMGTFMWIFTGFREITPLGASPIMLTATTMSFAIVAAGGFWLFKFYSELNYPRTQPHEGAPLPFRITWLAISAAVLGFLCLAWFVQTILVLFYY